MDPAMPSDPAEIEAAPEGNGEAMMEADGNGVEVEPSPELEAPLPELVTREDKFKRVVHNIAKLLKRSSPRREKISSNDLTLAQTLLADMMSTSGKNEKWCEVLQNFSKFAEESADATVFQTWIDFLREEKSRMLQEETQSREIDELKEKLKSLQAEKGKLLEEIQILQEKRRGIQTEMRVGNGNGEVVEGGGEDKPVENNKE